MIEKYRGDKKRIAAVLIRHYKNYDNVKFVPICDNPNYRYSVYVGNNGVGKSAILEALDVEKIKWIL